MAGNTLKGLRFPTGTDLKSPDAIKNLANDVDAKLPQNDSGWIDMSLINGWLHYDSGLAYPGGGGRSAQYRRLGDYVYCRGIIRSGTGNFTVIPFPFRWIVQWHQSCVSANAYGIVFGYDTNWELGMLIGSNGWLDLQHVHWHCDPNAGKP